MELRKKFSLAGCLIGLVALAAFVALWWGQYHYGPWGRAAALLSAALFALFYPELSAHPIDGAAADRLLQWLPTWPL